MLYNNESIIYTIEIMSVKIRLARRGSKKRPCYKIVVADSRSPRDGKFIEVVGSYNPLLKDADESRIKVDADKVKEWMGKGAQATETVKKLLKRAAVL